jgi:hypothetical protein
MKYDYSIGIFMLSALLFTACGSYKSKQQAAKLTFPELGSILHTKGEMWYASAEQIGKPIWDTPPEINAKQLPFNKKTYTTYARYMANAGRINGIPYVDSLPYKPKYIRLQLLDKISATAALNNKDNTNVREYLENDAAYKLVTRLDMTVPDAMMPELLGANNIRLVEDAQLGKHLVLTRGVEESKINLADVQIFDTGFSSFCWREDRYHRKQIEAILTENEKCPKGTFKKASKVESDKSYLKF